MSRSGTKAEAAEVADEAPARPSRLHLWLALGYAVVVVVAAVTVVLPAIQGAAGPDAASGPEKARPTAPPTAAAEGVAEGRAGPT